MVDYNINLNNKTILITGIAGFIASNLVQYILNNVDDVLIVGIDSMNDYYDVSLKEMRLCELDKYNDKFMFIQGDISDALFVKNIFDIYKPHIVVNLAAQAGVRYSITNPDTYIQSNIIGFYNILEACRHNNKLQHLVYASSSSVYGNNNHIPYSTDDKCDEPVSLYAATKKSNELFAYTYSKLYNIKTTGLRFFTVYGPCGRPDMAYFDFANKLCAGDNIKIFNYGNCKRDFTYIDDIVCGIYHVMQHYPETDVPYKIYNIGNGQPVSLLYFITILQDELVKHGLLPQNYDFDSHKQFVEMQPGDVEITYADTSELKKDFGYCPQTSLQDGLHEFIKWYKTYKS